MMKNRRRSRGAVAWLGVVVMIAALVVGTVAPASAATNVTLYVELNEWMSCPFVFTWNGQEYKIENDIFSVGRGPANEYTDYLGIGNSMQAKDGAYSFVIREVPSEKSYTDLLKLMVMDHPSGVKVGVDSSGNAHSYANPVAPSSAVDSKGNDVLSSVALKDDSGASLFHGDTVTLDFGSVDISNGAKLVLRADGFEGEPTGDVIAGIPAVRIQTLQSGTWVTRHTFFPKELWAEGVFDLRSYLTESQQVRLVSDSCLTDKYHVIDWAALDNTADQISMSVLDPASAMLNDTTDVLSLVAGSDNQYAFTQDEDFITVTFPVTPMDGVERDFAFVSEGYYEMGGNTYYLDTWNGSSWVQRGSWMLYSQGDQMRSLNVGPYLPDGAGEYKVQLRNRMSYSPQYAYVDYVYLVADGATYYPYQATEEGTGANILSLLTQSDDVKWYSMNKASIIKFDLNGPPNANAGPDQTVNATSPAGASVTLNGSGSSDPNSDPLTYSWSWSGGSASGVSPTVNMPMGTTAVTLTVSDGKYSDTDTASIQVVWSNLPPLADAGGPYSVNEGSSVVVSGSGSDPEGYPVTLAWDLDNDGQYDDATGATATFNAAGIDGPAVRNVGLQVSELAGLFWDFANATSSGGKSTATGAASGLAIGGYLSQTGGGPVEGSGASAWLPTRFIGPVNYPYIQFSTAEQLTLNSISFVHGHNHNPGFPTYNGYQVQLQINSGSGYTNIGSPLAANRTTSGQNATIALGGLSLNPGTYLLRWYAYGFSYGDNSNTEYFGLDNVSLNLASSVRSTDTATVTVLNVAPSVNAGSDVAINQGQSLANSGTFTDPGADSWTATVNCGDGSGTTALALVGKTFQLNHAYANTGVYVATITVRDDDGGVGSDTVTVTVRDVTPPTSTASAPAPNSAGWHKTDVPVSFSATDNLGGSGVKEIHYVVNGGADTIIPGASGSVLLNADGIYNIAFYAVDNAGNIENADSITVKLDKTPPVITGSRTPGANTYGWNNTDVTVTFACSDALSGVDVAPANVTLSVEGAGQSVTRSVTDKAGNSSSATVGGISIDKTKPALSFGATAPAPNAAGWNNTNATIGYTASDALSGVASTSTPSPLAFTVEGNNLTQSVTVTDKAGNSQTFTSQVVKLDKTSPAVAGSTTTDPNGYGWYNSNVTVKFVGTDALSGIASVTPDTVLSADGANQSVTGTAVDLAGNTSSCTVGGINIDKTAPVITGSRTHGANTYGWNNTDVTVTFACSDALSGVDVAPANVTLSAEGADQSVTRSVTDKAGNSASATVGDISIDKTKPTLSFGATAPAPNAAGWNNTNAIIAHTASDALSGVASTSTPSPLAFTVEGNNLTQSVTVTDKAGNSQTFTSQVVKLDKTAPVVTINSPQARSYLTTESITLDFGSINPMSGVLGESATLDGTAVSNMQVINLAAMAGNHTLTVVSTDNAGNVETVSRTFTVVINSVVVINPDTLNVKSQSDKNAITVYIEFPALYDVSRIDISTVVLQVNGKTIQAQLGPMSVGDYDGDGVLELMVKFDRQALVSALGATTGDVQMTVSGQLRDGRQFTGVDTIKVINPGK